MIVHSINTGNVKPIKQRYYPISPAVEKQLCGELDRMISLGVIEEAPNSSWSFPTVVVVKPGKVRMCVDSRKLNYVTIQNIDGHIARLPPVHCISKIDLKDAFLQIKLAKISKPNQFTRMPFGLGNKFTKNCFNNKC